MKYTNGEQVKINDSVRVTTSVGYVRIGEIGFMNKEQFVLCLFNRANIEHISYSDVKEIVKLNYANATPEAYNVQNMPKEKLCDQPCAVCSNTDTYVRYYEQGSNFTAAGLVGKKKFNDKHLKQVDVVHCLYEYSVDLEALVDLTIHTCRKCGYVWSNEIT